MSSEPDYRNWLVDINHVDAAGGMGRHLGVFSCTLLMCVIPPSSQRRVFSSPPQRRTHYWNWYLFHPVLDSWICGVGRCFSDALGSRIRIVVLRFVHLAGVWNNVSAQWRRKSIPGSRVQETKISRNGHLCRERHSSWLHCLRLHCKSLATTNKRRRS